MFGDPSCGATDAFGDPSCGATDAFGNPSSGATDAFGDPRFGATDAFSDPTITSFSEVLAFLKLYLTWILLLSKTSFPNLTGSL